MEMEAQLYISPHFSDDPFDDDTDVLLMGPVSDTITAADAQSNLHVVKCFLGLLDV